MKKLLVPLTMFIAGLFAARYLFKIDVLELIDGFGELLVTIFKGQNR